MKLQFSQKCCEKYSYVELNENPSGRSRVVTCGQTDGHTDMKKLTVTLRKFAIVLNTASSHHYVVSDTHLGLLPIIISAHLSHFATRKIIKAADMKFVT